MYPCAALDAPLALSLGKLVLVRANHFNPLNFRALLAVLPQAHQEALKMRARKLRQRVVNLIYSYGAPQLEQKLRDLGIGAGDAILMQSAFSTLNGFRGEASEVLDTVLKVIGPDGHLFMVSMPYSGAAADYLQDGKTFDVKRTPSQMGFLSELFRRRKGVLRSANPMHPVLAYGPRAEWLVTGHEELMYSCGEGSPFEKMLELDTKALLFDVDLDVLTFAHYLEHLFQDTAPARVYAAKPIETNIKDWNGTQRVISVYPFAREAMKLRNFAVLYEEVLRQKLVSHRRIGNTRLQLVRLKDVLRCGSEIVSRGGHIFARPGEPTRIKPARRGALGRVLDQLRPKQPRADS
jgi:aminoglycoside 3-N-acetyltransferase